MTRSSRAHLFIKIYKKKVCSFLVAILLKRSHFFCRFQLANIFPDKRAMTKIVSRKMFNRRQLRRTKFLTKEWTGSNLIRWDRFVKYRTKSAPKYSNELSFDEKNIRGKKLMYNTLIFITTMIDREDNIQRSSHFLTY